MTASDTKALVYGIVDDNLVLLPETVISAVLEDPEGMYESEEDESPSAASIALEALPDDLDDIGEEQDRFPGRPILFIDPDSEYELVETLGRRGYIVRRDDDLIRSI